MNIRSIMIAALSCLTVGAVVTACEPQTVIAKSAVTAQREEAQKVTVVEQTYSYEINNIQKRRILFGKPGVIGYVVFLNQNGQPVQYLTVDGKCTSASKRITRQDYVTTRTDDGWRGENNVVIRSVGEDGVYGDSEAYIYCWTADGRYVQWSGEYLYSDHPFDLTVKPLVVQLGNTIQHQ